MLQQRIRFSLLEEKSISKLFAVATAAVFALVLAGCGGNGGTAQMEEPEEPPMVMACPEGQVGTYPDCMDPPPPAEERIAAARGRADTAATNARADADAAAMLDDATATDVAAAIAMAEAAATAAEAARDAANGATDPNAAEALAAQAEISEGHADTALGNAMTASTAAAAAAVVAAAKAATTKAALTKVMQITAEGAQPTDAGLGGTATTATGNAEGAYSVGIERDRDSREVTITVEGDTDEADEDFMVAMDFMDGRTMQTRTMDADDDGNVMTEVVIVSTDIEAPKAVEFAKLETEDGMTPQALNVSTDTTNDTPDPTNEALGIVDGNLGMVKADDFTAPAGTTGTTVLTFQHAVEDDDGTADVDESMDAAEIMGTFNGSMGTYKCNAASANCSVTVDGKGVVSDVSTDNDWVFTPAMGVTTDQPDYDYLHYGFWLKRTADKDGVTTYNEVETFAGSSVAVSGSVASVRGSATYEGGAVGVYVHKTFETDGTSDATSGHFKAEASLTATFGQTTEEDIAPNMLNTLRGTIDNFDLSGGETQGWSVSLSGDIAEDAGTAASAEDSDSDVTFSATFHGDTEDDDNNATVQPSSVVGEFNADFSNGSVAGAFGARKE